MTEQETVIVEETHYCEVHPDRESSLRCNRCGRYMCVQCAVHTPVGYRCRECVHEQTDRFFSATQTDYVITFVVCAGLSLIAGTLASTVGIIIILLLLAVPVGSVIGQVALQATGRRRGRNSATIAVAGSLIGGALGSSVYYYLMTGILFINPLRDIVALIFAGLVAVTVGGMFRVRI